MVTVTQIMTRSVVKITMDESMQKIQELFERYHFHHLLVFQEDRLVGIISDRDVLQQLSPYIHTLTERNRDVQTLQKRAHQIMSRQVVTISPDKHPDEAVDLLLNKGISCLPVVDAEGTVIGILTWRDLLRHYANRSEIWNTATLEQRV